MTGLVPVMLPSCPCHANNARLNHRVSVLADTAGEFKNHAHCELEIMGEEA
ncbi:MAG: hypothetical protein NVSMB38_40650 [Ktedonobacteraceae bacterium]